MNYKDYRNGNPAPLCDTNKVMPPDPEKELGLIISHMQKLRYEQCEHIAHIENKLDEISKGGAYDESERCKENEPDVNDWTSGMARELYILSINNNRLAHIVNRLNALI